MMQFRVCMAFARELSNPAAFGIEGTFSLSAGLKQTVTKEIGRRGLARVGQDHE